MVVHLLKQYLGYMLVNLAPGFYMDIFYSLSSLFALESFLSSQCTSGNTVLIEVSVFRGICLFLLDSKAKSQKWQKQNSGFEKHFMLCSIFR